MIAIPLIDARSGGLRQLLADRSEQAISLIDASRRTLGPLSEIGCRMLMPFGDRLSRDWLVRSGNPYLEEINYIAGRLQTPGIYALNVCFEWGCTSAAYATETGPVLTRVMDWMFPKLGENIVVARQAGPAGEFYNVTWPGVSGMFQGMAPGRFAISINQAPMQRHRLGFVGDWAYNRKQVFKTPGMPPAHLLRQVFEEAKTYDEAKERLSRTPIALPVIYILSGIGDGEGCVIERTETDFAIREFHNGRACAANHFETRLNETGHGWRPRRFNSLGRAKQANGVSLADIDEKFSWFCAPIANAHTRLVMKADAGSGGLSVFGTHGQKPVTEVFRR